MTEWAGLVGLFFLPKPIKGPIIFLLENGWWKWPCGSKSNTLPYVYQWLKLVFNYHLSLFHYQHRKRSQESSLFYHREWALQQWSSVEPLLSHGPTLSLPLFMSLCPSLLVPSSPIFHSCFLTLFTQCSFLFSFKFVSFYLFWVFRSLRLRDSVFGAPLIKPWRYALQILNLFTLTFADDSVTVFASVANSFGHFNITRILYAGALILLN